MMPPAPETPLQLIKCVAACLYAKHLGVSVKQTIYIVLIFIAVEQKRTYVKYLLPVINMLMTFEQLISCGFRYSLAVSTRMPYCPILTFEDDST